MERVRVRTIKQGIWLCSLMTLTLWLTACSTAGVKPWEKSILSRPSMQLNAPSLDLLMDDHFYFSKEGLSGGRGFAGGGCGCN
jgi:hypothetical protein